MAHHPHLSDLSPDEQKYIDLVNHGDDFSKIEIYRSAIEWYNMALKVKPLDQNVLEKISFCKSQIKFEKKVIYIVVSIFAIATALFIIL